MAAYLLSHMLVIQFWSGSLRSSPTSFPFNRVSSLNLALTFSKLTQHFLIKTAWQVRFFTSFLILTNIFDKPFFFVHEQHACQQICEKKLPKRIYILSLRWSQFSRKITQTGKAGAVKVYDRWRQNAIRHKSFKEDNITAKVTWHNVMLKLHCVSVELGRFHLSDTNGKFFSRSVQSHFDYLKSFKFQNAPWILLLVKHRWDSFWPTAY